MQRNSLDRTLGTKCFARKQCCMVNYKQRFELLFPFFSFLEMYQHCTTLGDALFESNDSKGGTFFDYVRISDDK